jgi:pimeloyl-ACP methyl ester carboxylesterase
MTAWGPWHVTSADGSRIGVETVGSGPDLVAVHGTTADRSRWAPVRDALSTRYTLHLVDRRGRGSSQEESSGPYALAREVEDVLAVLGRLRGPAHLVGHSYGALVGLEVLAAAGPGRLRTALLYEPAFGPRVMPREVLGRIGDLLDEGDREGALETFYRDVVGVDPTPLKALPVWEARIAAVHTVVREAGSLDYAPDPARLAATRVPVRVLLGTDSPQPFADAACAARDCVPGAELVELPGQGHTMIDADPAGFVRQVVGWCV